MSERRRRSTDRGWHRLIRENAYRDVWLLTVTIVVILIAAKAFDTSSTAANHERRTHAALCTFWNDLKQRVEAGEAFLVTHPQGIPGIPAATLRTSIAGQRRTVSALRGLGCHS